MYNNYSFPKRQQQPKELQKDKSISCMLDANNMISARSSVYHIMLWLLQTGSTIKVRMKKIIWRFFGVVHFLFQSKNIQNNIFSLKSAEIIKIFSLGRKNNIAIKKQRPRCRLPIVSATENKARTSSSSQIESSQVIFI